MKKLWHELILKHIIYKKSYELDDLIVYYYKCECGEVLTEMKWI